jgi:hypothetical protein
MCRGEVEDFLPHFNLLPVRGNDKGVAARPTFPGTEQST